MRAIAQDRRHARAGRRRSGEQGLTLIELLLSLAILAVLTGFLAAGLSMARRAFETDRASGIGAETDAALQAISTVIGSSLPVRASSAADQHAAVVFDGRKGALVFVGLSEGRSLRGGPHRIGLRQYGTDLVIDVIGSGSKAQTAELSVPGSILLSGVRRIEFGYFGRANSSAAPGWRTEWVGLDHLPELVSVRIDFEDGRRNELATIIALRQG